MHKLIIATSLAFAPALSFGHGTQAPADVVNGQIATRSFINSPYDTEATTTAPPLDRSFEIVTIDVTGDDSWARPAPGGGFVIVPNRFTTGSSLTMQLTDALKVWDGSSFVPTGGEAVRIQKSEVPGEVSNIIAPASLTGPLPSLGLLTISGAAGQHGSLTWSLLGDGVNNKGGDDGAYLVSYQLTNPGGAALPSLVNYALVEKNVSPDVSSAALAYVDNVLAVPEPTTMALTAVALVTSLARRRRAR